MKKILVVDDEESILLSLSYVLKSGGAEVVTCKSIELAKEALADESFDLVITDIRLSDTIGSDGLELLKFIRERYRSGVIVMTGFDSEEIERLSYESGALHYFRKPVDIGELLSTVAEAGAITDNVIAAGL